MMLFKAIVSTVIVCSLSVALAGERKQALPDSDTNENAVDLTPQQVRDAVRLVLQREATAEDSDQRAAAIRDLSKLYVGIVRDEEMALDARLKLKAKVYSRLIRVRDDLKNNIRRHEDDADAAVDQYPIHESLSETTPSRGGGVVRDYGETLVELIQHVISPDHWDVNGGPGSIVYYPNLKVLVVRASGDAHGHVGGLFDGLRRP
jgi:hypothetical protein